MLRVIVTEKPMEPPTSEWQPIETAPKDGGAILLLSVPYELDAGPNGKHWIPAKCAIGKWWAEGTSWVQDGPRNQPTYNLAKTGIWLSGGGWFQPDEVSHWMPLPKPPKETNGTTKD